MTNGRWGIGSLAAAILVTVYFFVVAIERRDFEGLFLPFSGSVFGIIYWLLLAGWLAVAVKGLLTKQWLAVFVGFWVIVLSWVPMIYAGYQLAEACGRGQCP